MNEFIEVIGQLRPKNNAKFALADVNDLRGGYIQVTTVSEMENFLSTNKLKEGMLCYVKNSPTTDHMYQYYNGVWNIWQTQGGGGGGGGISIVIVNTLQELLDNEELRIKGQIVFVNELEGLLFYNGKAWESFSRIYIQDTPPEDTGGIWIDTSEKKEHLSSSTVIQDLLKVITILQEKVQKLEFAFECQMDSGDFKNNQYYAYDGQENEEPNYGTSEEEDDEEQLANKDVILADSPEPTEYSDELPNVKHICIKSGTYAEMQTNKADFMPKELLWCYDTQALYIKDPKTFKLIKIGSTGGGPEPGPDPETMEGILTEVIGSGSTAKTKIIGIEFADMTNKESTFLIQIKNGKLDIHDYRLDRNTLAGNAQAQGTGIYYTTPYFPIIPEEVGSKDSPKIYINMVYCGGDSTDKDYNPVSHNFVELCNLGKKDVNLKGLYLHYTERNTGDWVTLPLTGVLKSQRTFLIKGSQCSVENINTTLIRVEEPDIEWTKSNTLNNTRLEISGDVGAGIKEHSIWGNDNRIKFEYNCALYISSEETTDYFKGTVLNTTAPWTSNGVIKWYVDLVGIGNYNDKSMPCEASPFAIKGKDILLMRYYNMDPVKQATKALSARSNSKDWTYIYLANINPAISIQDYVPKNSSQNKNIFFNKHLLESGAPNIVTCTLGHDAHKTRGFNWISVGYYDEYIWIKKEGEEYTEANKFESFKSEDFNSDGVSQNPNRPQKHKNWTNPIYNRIRSITTDGTPFTVHKFLKDFEEPVDSQKYYYKCGREGAWTEERSFTLRNREKVIANGYNFLQISDQQGFNSEEYEMWRVCAEYIDSDKSTNPYEWCLNTGDQTQNGNRFNEWVDYYKGGDAIYKDTEQMFTVGNNDLTPVDVYTLGDGEDLSKTNPANVEFFFTFEHPFTVPISSAGVYVPCVYSFVYGDTYFLSMNSEITELARTEVFGDIPGVNVYDDLKEWATNDLDQHSADTKIKWKVAFCHESPFTIITADLIMSYLKRNNDGGYDKNVNIKRGGSHLNTVGNYWFSQWIQDNGFKLCLCGHKHTYSNTRYIREDPNKTMEPIVYDSSLTPTWYTSLPDREKQCVQISTDTTLNYVKYVMVQATGFKLISNKELPAKNIPWLLEYYPVSSQVENNTTNTATVKVNTAQQYPNYILWNIGKGKETENPLLPVNLDRDRILGKSYKIQLKDDTKLWVYNYNVPITYQNLKKVGGNGSNNPNNNIIIEKTL